MKKNILLSIFSIIIILFFFEIFFRKNKNLISLDLLHYYPHSNVRNNLYEFNGFKKWQDNFYEKKINGKIFKFYSSPLPVFSMSHSVDQKFNATDIYYYNQGFCNRNYNSKNIKIIAVGDSFTFCTAVEPENAWPKMVSNELSANQILNLGYPGSGPFEYNLILKEYIRRDNQLVLYGFYEGNDLRDMINFTSDNKTPTAKLKIKEFIRLLINNSYVSTYLVASFKLIKSKLADENFRYSRVSFNQKFNVTNTDLDEIYYAKKLFHEKNISEDQILDHSYYKNILKKNFLEAKNISDLNGSKIIFIYIPSAYTVFKNDIKFEDKNIENYVNFYSTETKKIFNKICIEAKLHCIDTVSALQNYNDKNYFPTHFPSNVHLTKIGHDVISTEIRNYVCKNLKNLSKDLQLKCKIN